jgi:glycosyltransferase involved in cell wall biosynthesis
MVGIDPDAFPERLTGVTGPLVSIVLPTYEPEDTIAESITSVVDQTYASIQLVVVDGSDEAALQRLGDRCPWVSYVAQTGAGVANAKNEGIEAADGEFVAFLDDDDYYLPEKTETQVERLEDGCDVVYSDEYIITQDGDRLTVEALPVTDRETHYRTYFRSGQGVPQLTVMARRACFDDHLFDESLDAREDPHLWVRLFRAYRPCHLPEPLAYKRRRDGSLTSDPELMLESELAEIDDLVDRFVELRPYADSRRAWAKYRYCRSLVDAGRDADARPVLVDLLGEDPTHVNAGALLAAILSPGDSRRTVERLERVKYRLSTSIGSLRMNPVLRSLSQRSVNREAQR